MMRAGKVSDVQRPRDGDLAVFERLAQAFERRGAKLGELVEEQHAEVRQADLAGPRRAAAADEAAAEMVWCGARNGRRATSGTPGGSRPATL